MIAGEEIGMFRLFLALAIAMLFLLSGAAAVEDVKAGPISVKDAWSRATPEGTDVGVGYLTITNDGDAPDRLVSAEAAFAAQAEIHQLAMNNGVMHMRPVPEGVTVPSKGKLVFSPDSYHLMFMGLKGPLKEGDTVAGSLTFKHAGKVEVTFHVESMGAAGPEGAHHH
jgi:periplasmic copper chaperone A